MSYVSVATFVARPPVQYPINTPKTDMSGGGSGSPTRTTAMWSSAPSTGSAKCGRYNVVATPFHVNCTELGDGPSLIMTITGLTGGSR